MPLPLLIALWIRIGRRMRLNARPIISGRIPFIEKGSAFSLNIDGGFDSRRY